MKTNIKIKKQKLSIHVCFNLKKKKRRNITKNKNFFYFSQWLNDTLNFQLIESIHNNSFYLHTQINKEPELEHNTLKKKKKLKEIPPKTCYN